MARNASSAFKTAMLAGVFGAALGVGFSMPAQAQTVNADAVRSTVQTIFPDFNINRGTQTFTGLGKTITTTTSSNRTFATLDEDDSLRIQVNGQDVFRTSGGFKHIKDIRADDFNRLISLLGVDFEQSQNIAQTEQTRSQTSTTIRTISGRISSFLAPRPAGARTTADAEGAIPIANGMAGGDMGLKYAAWGNFSFSNLENEGAASQARTDAYDGNLGSGLLGADLLIDDMYLVGLALSRERLDLTMTTIQGTLQQDGYGIIPYIGARFLDGTIVTDALFGYIYLDNEETQLSNTFRGNFSGSRYIAAGNVTYNYLYDNFILSPSVGINFAYEAGDGYTDNFGTQRQTRETYIGDLKIGGRLGYVWDKAEFYTAHYYVWDAVPMFSDTIHSGLDRDEVSSTFGINYAFEDGVTLTGEFNNTFDRENITDYSFVAAMRVEF